MGIGKRKLFFVISLLLLIGTVGAQGPVKLFGYVTDEEDVPLENSLVTILIKHNHISFSSTRTNNNGYYELVVPYQASYNLFVEDRINPNLFKSYIPARKMVSVGQSDELRVDFKLRPGANIVIQAYDNSGSLLRNKDLKEVTNEKVFATDLNDILYYAEFLFVFDSYSRGNMDLGIPAFVVLPQTSYRIHVLWEVPGFGEIMLSADNEGEGYSIDRQGGSITLNFNYEAAKSKLSMLQKDYDLFISQGYEISDSVVEDLNLSKEHFRIAESYLFQTPGPDMRSAVEELELSLNHSLWAHEQLYLDKAEADIERYRKGDVKIKVVDEEGELLSNCSISFNQTNHDFLFAVPESPNHHRIADLLKQAGINYIYTYFPYGVFEPELGRFQWKDIEVNALLDDDFRLIGMLGWLFYCAPWETPEHSCPRYLDNMSFEEVKENVYNHMYAIADRYKGKIDVFEAIFEPCLQFMNEFNWTWNQKFEMYRTATTAIKDANPEAKILSTDVSLSYEIIRNYKPGDLDLDAEAEEIPFSEFITFAIEKQVPIDIIGMSFLNSGVDVYAGLNIHLTLDLVSISNLLDQYSKFNKSIFFREHQAPSTQVEGGGWWHRPWDEQTQAEYVEKFYTLVFSKPLVIGAGWSTGVSDDLAQKYGCLSCGLLDSDLEPKPSYFALKNLINSWKTNGTGKTDWKGEFEFRGFAGNYNITITCLDGNSSQVRVHVNEDVRNEFSFTLSTMPAYEETTTLTYWEENILIFVAIFIITGLLALAYMLRKR